MCVQQYNSIAAVQQKKQIKAERGFELALCLSRIQRSTADPKGNVVIDCRLREGNLEKSSLAEFCFDARSFARDREGCCVGGRLARSRGLGGSRGWTRICLWGMVQPTCFQRPTWTSKPPSPPPLSPSGPFYNKDNSRADIPVLPPF